MSNVLRDDLDVNPMYSSRWESMHFGSGHHSIPEMKIFRPKMEALSSTSAQFFGYSF
jgi:hypothetical protein